MVVMGVDVGFGFTKATDGESSVLFKSLIGEPQPRSMEENFFPGEGISGSHLTLDERSFFVGELAESESRVRQFTLDHSQMVAQQFRILALASIARIAPSRVPINVVTGLPVGHFIQYRNHLAEALTGDHSIVLHQEGKEREVVLRIKRVRTIPQPYGSLVDFLFRDDGTLLRTDLARGRIGLVDIGFKTTDFIITRGLRHSERGSRTTDIGIAKAFQYISEALTEMSGVAVEVYRLYDAVREGSLKIRGVEYDLTNVKNEVFGLLAAAVANDMERIWSDDWDLDLILVAGGGGEALYEYLKPLVKGELALLQTREDPRMANVAGFVKYGRYFFDGSAAKES